MSSIKIPVARAGWAHWADVQAPESYLNEDNEWQCSHINTEIERACCSGSDCACRGMDAVICHDCDSEQLTDEEVQSMLEPGWL